MIEINNQIKAPISLQLIKNVLNQALKKLNRQMNISVVLVDGITIRRLNRRYRKINRITDVLSFANLDKNLPVNKLLTNGEIIICYSRARQQALAQRHLISQEIKILLLHSLLHLLGYHHQTLAQKQLMDKKMQQLIKK